MKTCDFACVFARASGDRLVVAERLLMSFRELFAPALVEVDLAYRVPSRFLLATLRFEDGPDLADVRARLQFWTARAGGRASAIASMGEGDVRAFRASFEACELQAKGVSPGELFEAAGHLFTAAGAPPGRRRGIAERLAITMDVAGPGWEGVRYHADSQTLFVPAPISPPVGDAYPLSFRLPGFARPFGVRGVVVGTRAPEAAVRGEPAGYTLLVEAPPPALADALARHAPWGQTEATRVAPRYTVHAPVKVIVPPPPAAPGAGDADATRRACIEYATDQELAADWVENLSQGGAFVRTPHAAALGSEVALELRLPNGAELRTTAKVAFTNAQGMGVQFELDAEADEILAAAIAHISARSRRALVVDDDALSRRMLSDALQARGFEVLTAADAEAGLQTLAEEVLALDLLVTDLQMPGMDGEALVRTIRTAGGETELAIVAVTARMEDGVETRLEAAGADAVIDKAVGPELIAQAADAVVERRRLDLDAAA